jgi:hypothetical protein
MFPSSALSKGGKNAIICPPSHLTFVFEIKAWMGRWDGGAVLGSTGRESRFPL